MRDRRFGWIAAAIVLATGAATPPARAGDDAATAEAALKDLGLRLRKSRFVLASEEERVLKEYGDARKACDKAEAAQGRSAELDGVVEAAAMDEQMAQVIGQEIQVVSAQARTASGGRGASYLPIQAQVRMLQAQLREVQAEAQALKGLKVDDKMRKEAADKADRARAEFREAAVVLRRTLEDLAEQYQEAADDPAAKRAVDALSRARKVPYKIGPSDEVARVGRWLVAATGSPLPRPRRRPPGDAPNSPVAAIDRAQAAVRSLSFEDGSVRESQEFARKGILDWLDGARRMAEEGKAADDRIAMAVAGLDAFPDAARLSIDGRRSIREARRLLKGSKTP